MRHYVVVVKVESQSLEAKKIVTQVLAKYFGTQSELGWYPSYFNSDYMKDQSLLVEGVVVIRHLREDLAVAAQLAAYKELRSIVGETAACEVGMGSVEDALLANDCFKFSWMDR